MPNIDYNRYLRELGIVTPELSHAKGDRSRHRDNYMRALGQPPRKSSQTKQDNNLYLYEVSTDEVVLDYTDPSDLYDDYIKADRKVSGLDNLERYLFGLLLMEAENPREATPIRSRTTDIPQYNPFDHPSP